MKKSIFEVTHGGRRELLAILPGHSEDQDWSVLAHKKELEAAGILGEVTVTWVDEPDAETVETRSRYDKGDIPVEESEEQEESE